MLCLVSLKFQPSSMISRLAGLRLVRVEVAGNETAGSAPSKARCRRSRVRCRSGSSPCRRRPVAYRNVPSPSVSSNMMTRSWPGAVGPPVRIGQALDDPQPAAIVEGEGDRLHDVRLAGEERGVEAGRQRHLLGRFDRRQRLALGQRNAGREMQSRIARERRFMVDWCKVNRGELSEYEEDWRRAEVQK